MIDNRCVKSKITLNNLMLNCTILLARKRPSLPQLKKYDVTQRVVTALTNVESRALLFATIKSARTASDLSKSLRIPLSTVYKKVIELDDLALIREGTEFRVNSGKVKVYTSRIKAAEIHIKRIEPRITLIPNKK